MISTLFFNALYAVVHFILTPIINSTDVTLPADIASSITSASNYIRNVDNIFPVATMLLILASYLIIEAGVGIYKLIMWLVKKIPTIN